MEDIIQKYKKEKRNKNIAIIATSLVLAFWINFFVSNTDSWKYIKSSVINSSIWTEAKTDLYLEKLQNTWNILIKIKSSAQMTQVKSLSFSISYNKDNVSIKDKKINFNWWNLINVIDNDWYNTLIINFDNPTNIKSWDEIMNLVIAKEQNSPEQINLVNSNMTDSENNLFTLSTSWIDF